VPNLADPVDPDLVADLARYAGTITDAAGPPAVLAHRTGELVVRCGAVVVKAHAAEAVVAPHLALLDLPGLDAIMLTPLGRTRIGGRDVTAWPAGVALRPDEAYDAPWATAGTLLGRLHATPLPAADVPACGGPGRVDRALRRLAASPARTGRRAAAVRAAYETLPLWARGQAAAPELALTHGDWHLGQLVRVSAGWRMIDADDLGYGYPGWDLARPAAWYAAGIMPPELWDRFLTAYRASGGTAVPPTGDPWPALDVPARALTVQTAALAVAGGDLDTAEAFVASCGRIAGVGFERGSRALSKLLRR
jgi:hypothetical protein